MKKKHWFILSLMATIILSTVKAVHLYNLGYRGEQVYTVYPLGLIVWFIMFFMIVLVTGGEVLLDDEDGGIDEKR